MFGWGYRPNSGEVDLVLFSLLAAIILIGFIYAKMKN